MTGTGTKQGHGDALAQSYALIERALGTSPAFRKVDTGLYVVKQGSSYVMISVLASGPNRDRALVRVTAQVVSGVRPEPSLFRQLLILNGTLRFGAFAYVPEGEIILFTHSLLGGQTLDANEILATVGDVALVADGYDDRIVARYGGRRMQDVIEESAMAHLLNPEEAGLDEESPLLRDEPVRGVISSVPPPAKKAPRKSATAARKPQKTPPSRKKGT